MTATTAPSSYTIKETAALTGLPASTLRYYESIGIITPIARGASSNHRVYGEADLDLLMWVKCLHATGMSIGDMRSYVRNRTVGPDAAGDQIALLSARRERLAVEREQLAIRQRYVDIKISYWEAVRDHDESHAASLARDARALADQLVPRVTNGN